MKEPVTASRPPNEVEADQLRNLLQIGIELSATRDRRKMLEMILTEARRLSSAQAGTFYVRREGRLEFAVAQNDTVEPSRLAEALLGDTLPLDGDSMAGYVASTGRIVNVPDAYRLDPGAPFRIHRRFDAATGYRSVSVLGIPLKCPDGQVVGVLQLINRLTTGGSVVPFPETDHPNIMSLASMAAVKLHNVLLADRLEQAHLDTVIRLSLTAEFRDKGTADHIQRISRISALIARSFGLPEEQVELIRQASPMHDIGKIGIPDAVLLKPGPLTPAERKIVETHPLIAADILDNPTNELMQMARDIALHHHERWDGGGYPHRLKGAEIPLPARIVSLADVFDALSTDRPYKDAFSIDVVVQIVRRERGKHFDPALVEAFFKAFDDVLAVYARR